MVKAQVMIARLQWVQDAGRFCQSDTRPTDHRATPERECNPEIITGHQQPKPAQGVPAMLYGQIVSKALALLPAQITIREVPSNGTAAFREKSGVRNNAPLESRQLPGSVEETLLAVAGWSAGAEREGV